MNKYMSSMENTWCKSGDTNVFNCYCGIIPFIHGINKCFWYIYYILYITCVKKNYSSAIKIQEFISKNYLLLYNYL